MANKIGSLYERVISANQKLHTVLANSYNETEPHFRAENVAYVDKRLSSIFTEIGAERLLDLGCGTGFIIDIAKKYATEIDGVDVTEAMLRRVDRSGNAVVRVHLSDSGSFPVEEGVYDIVTAYSFLHHLYNIDPTLQTAAKALRRGGKFYADLEPNFYFWKSVSELNQSNDYDLVVKREMESIGAKDSEIEDKFHVDKETFNQAEYSKAILGGFTEEKLTERLLAAGFEDVKIYYYWFLGQAALVNDLHRTRDERLQIADIFSELLTRGLPLTRHLFKYLGFIATR